MLLYLSVKVLHIISNNYLTVFSISILDVLCEATCFDIVLKSCVYGCVQICVCVCVCRSAEALEAGQYRKWPVLTWPAGGSDRWAGEGGLGGVGRRCRWFAQSTGAVPRVRAHRPQESAVRGQQNCPTYT